MKLVLAILLGLVKADIPVSCLRNDAPYVGSTWTIHVSEGGGNNFESKGSVNLYSQDIVCSHRFPNRVQLMDEKQDIKFEKETQWRVKILDERRVLAQDQDGKEVNGFWDILYQEDLLIQLENDMRFISSFKYVTNPGVMAQYQADDKDSPIKNIAMEMSRMPTHETSKFETKCDQTMIGFVQKVNGGELFNSVTIKCFYGVLNEKQKSTQPKLAQQEEKKQETQEKKQDATEKTESKNNVETSLTSGKDKIVLLQTSNPEKKDDENITEYLELMLSDNVKNDMFYTVNNQYEKFLDHDNKSQKFDLKDRKMTQRKQFLNKKRRIVRQKVEYPWEPSPSNDEFLMWAKQNEQQLGWSANLCLLSKDHKHYNKKKCEDKPINLAQGDYKNPFGEGDGFSSALQMVQAPSQKYGSAAEIPEADLPQTFDLRNILNYDFTGEVRDQQKCGSCFAHSVVQVAESRLKIKTGKKIPNLSVQAILGCDFLAEGCEGGWSTNTAFFLENGQLVTEECAPYLAQSADNCAAYSECKPQARVKNTLKMYKPNEQKIMQEIYRNGPVSVSWNPPPFISTYQSGVLGYSGGKDGPSVDSYLQEQTSLEVFEEQPAHASILVGWDVDPKHGPVWILRNSFGTGFGQQGDVLIPKGKNLFNTETHITVFDPELI